MPRSSSKTYWSPSAQLLAHLKAYAPSPLTQPPAANAQEPPSAVYRKPVIGDFLNIENGEGVIDDKTFRVIRGGKYAAKIIDTVGRRIPTKEKVVIQEVDKDGSLIGSPQGLAIGPDRV